MNIEKSSFGKLKDGREVTKFTLSNDNYFSVSILNYGGIITEIMVPDKCGKIENVVLGFDTITQYEDYSPYFGCLVGRTSGRISNSCFELEGQKYELVTNHCKSNLHGGTIGFDKVIWECEEKVSQNEVILTMKHHSKHMEEGYPGAVDVTVEYVVNNNNDLEIRYKATTDRKTIIDMTNHTYFNLSGDLKETTVEHDLFIDADKYIPVDDEIIPLGYLEAVDETPFDFRTPKEVGTHVKADNIQIKNGLGYDHPFVLNHKKACDIELADLKSGRRLQMTTDAKVVVFYSGNYLTHQLAGNTKLSGGVEPLQHLGLCLETQGYPNAINVESFPCEIYDAEKAYSTQTKYSFKW